VTVAPCTAAGRLRSDPIPGRAELLPGSERAHLDQLMARKYSWLARVTLFRIDQLLQRLKGKRARAPTAVLAITPVQPSAPDPGGPASTS
jgi:hypothetical protein